MRKLRAQKAKMDPRYTYDDVTCAKCGAAMTVRQEKAHSEYTPLGICVNCHTVNSAHFDFKTLQVFTRASFLRPDQLTIPCDDLAGGGKY